MKKTNLALALILSSGIVACSAYETRPTAPAMVSNGILTGSNSMTLYTFDKDVADSGKSVCNDSDGCATRWPPLYAMAGDKASGDYSIIVRDDGKKQWALKGKPLYYWFNDKKPGDMTGDGFKNVWHIIKP